MFFSKWPLRISSACGVNEVRRLRFFDGSLPINSVRFCIPDRWRASASAIQRSRTGLIFWALLGVMSNFSNLAGYKRPGFSLPVRLLPIVFSWASCGRKKWLLRMVCLGRVEKTESYSGALTNTKRDQLALLPALFSTGMPRGPRLQSRWASEPKLLPQNPPGDTQHLAGAVGLCPDLATVEQRDTDSFTLQSNKTTVKHTHIINMEKHAEFLLFFFFKPQQY